MGLDMYLERRELIKKNDGSIYECATNPLIRTVEITSVGYWRKKEELDNFIADITGDTDYSNCRDWYISYEKIEQIIDKANERIAKIPQEIELAKHQQQDKRISDKTKLKIKWEISDKEWELSGWESAKEIFTKAKADLEKNKNVDYYYSRWY